MDHANTCRLFVAACLLSSAALSNAQTVAVPRTVAYQGRIAVNGTNFHGTGYFKFALAPENGSPSWTSSPDESPRDGVPDTAVAVEVANGLYSVRLGEQPMTAIPEAALRNNDVQLRVWFDDGLNGTQRLDPDQFLAAVPYALIAAGVNLPANGSAGAGGVIRQEGRPLIHSSGPDSTTRNFFAGYNAGRTDTAGVGNTGVGAEALYNNVGGAHNTGVGLRALTVNGDGHSNTAVGAKALETNLYGNWNTAVGTEALNLNITGFGNTAVGYQALPKSNTTFNTGFGYQALEQTAGGEYNTALGADTLSSNVEGSSNVAVGVNALLRNTGSTNIGLGPGAGSSLTSGSNNIAIGHNGVAAEGATIRIGTAGSQSRAFVAGIRGVTTGAANAVPVVIDSNGQLGTVSSSLRYKEDVMELGDASAGIYALRPVAFRYSKPYDNGEKPIQFGLIAEEVANAFPELAVYNDEGQPETVKYQDLTPLLLNEVQKLRAEKDELKQESTELRARLEKLEALINKGSAQ